MTRILPRFNKYSKHEMNKGEENIEYTRRQLYPRLLPGPLSQTALGHVYTLARTASLCPESPLKGAAR